MAMELLPENSDSLSQLLTPEQAAKLLQISRRSLDRYRAESLIPYMRLPQRGRARPIRFVRAELCEWMKSNGVEPGRFVVSRLDGKPRASNEAVSTAGGQE